MQHFGNYELEVKLDDHKHEIRKQHISTKIESVFEDRLEESIRKQKILFNDIKESNKPSLDEKANKDVFENFLNQCYKNENSIPIPGLILRANSRPFSLVGKHMNDA